MLSRRLKMFVLAAALTVLPLQGIAAAMSALLCHGDAQAHATHEGSSHDHGSSQGKHHDEGAAGESSYHLCCHYTVSVPSVIVVATAPPDFPVRAFDPDSLHDLFVPEQPQRPPLA
jgi:hypothetical protein